MTPLLSSLLSSVAPAVSPHPQPTVHEPSGSSSPASAYEPPLPTQADPAASANSLAACTTPIAPEASPTVSVAVHGKRGLFGSKRQQLIKQTISGGAQVAPPAADPSGPLSATAEERHASFSDGCMVGFSDAAPPPLASVPEDVLRMLQALEVKNEEETLLRAAAYCDAHAPPSLQNLAEDPATLEAFLSAVRLAKIPEKKARKAIAASRTAAPNYPPAPDDDPREDSRGRTVSGDV